jgi:ring-1,2-phenylacetyl-CoA epoxidase subunit PaaE
MSKIYHLKVKEVVKETSDAVTIRFFQPDEKINYKPGQFLTLIMPIEGEKVRRAYSLCTSPYTDDDLAVTVKKVIDGKVSNYVFEHIQAGQVIELMEPLGAFTPDINPDKKRHVILLGGGSGITPLMGILKSVLLKEPASKVSLIYANRNEESIIFRRQLKEYEEKYQNRFKVVLVLDHPGANWTGISGILNPQMLKEILTQLPDTNLEREYFTCGPQGMMDTVTVTLQQMGIPLQKLKKESFVSNSINTSMEKTNTEVKPEGLVAREITVIYDGSEHKFTVQPDKTILETALEMDIDLPYSCQSGLCTACRGKCISGKVKMDEEEGLSDAELRQGYVLTCVGHPVTDNVIIEIG